MKKFFYNYQKWFFRFSSIFVILILISFIKLDYYIYMPGNLTDVSKEVTLVDDRNELNGSVSSVYVLSMTRPTVFEYLVTKDLKYAKLVKITKSEAQSIDTKLDTAIGRFDSSRSFSQAELASYSMLHEGEDFYKEITYIYSAEKETISSINYYKLVGNMISGFPGFDNSINYPTVEEISAYLKSVPTTEKATLYLTSSNNINTTVELERHEDENNNFVYGITLMRSFMLTVDSFLDVSNVYTEGPSGGAMQALYIYLKLTNEDLLKGRNIAGTGTINYKLDEYGHVVNFTTVGTIGCVEQKLYGAYLDKATVFYCPKSNYESCMKAYELYGFKEEDIRVVCVETLDDIINDLRGTE